MPTFPASCGMSGSSAACRPCRVVKRNSCARFTAMMKATLASTRKEAMRIARTRASVAGSPQSIAKQSLRQNHQVFDPADFVIRWNGVRRLNPETARAILGAES